MVVLIASIRRVVFSSTPWQERSPEAQTLQHVGAAADVKERRAVHPVQIGDSITHSPGTEDHPPCHYQDT